jgi:hypothetical protein
VEFLLRRSILITKYCLIVVALECINMDRLCFLKLGRRNTFNKRIYILEYLGIDLVMERLNGNLILSELPTK